MKDSINKIRLSKERYPSFGDPSASQGDLTTMNCSESDHQFKILFEPERRGVTHRLNQQTFEFGIDKENFCTSDFLTESRFQCGDYTSNDRVDTECTEVGIKVPGHIKYQFNP